MVDLVKAVREAAIQRNAAVALKGHPHLGQFVTDDYTFKKGVKIVSGSGTRLIYTTLGPITMSHQGILIRVHTELRSPHWVHVAIFDGPFDAPRNIEWFPWRKPRG